MKSGRAKYFNEGVREGREVLSGIEKTKTAGILGQNGGDISCGGGGGGGGVGCGIAGFWDNRQIIPSFLKGRPGRFFNWFRSENHRSGAKKYPIGLLEKLKKQPSVF